MLFALVSAALAVPPAAPAASSPLSRYEAAVTTTTLAVRAALPRIAACAKPNAKKLVFKITLDDALRVTTTALGQPAGAAAPVTTCQDKVVRDVFARTRPAVGTEAVFVYEVDAARIDGDVALFGSLGADAIETGVRDRLDLVSQCYLVGLVDSPGLAGELAVSFTVLPDGRAYGPVVKRTQLWNPTVEECVLRMVATAVFPPPDGGAIVRVTYPFTFAPPQP